MSSHTPAAAMKYMGCRDVPLLLADSRNAVNSGSPAIAGERRITARWSTTMAVRAIARPMPRMTPRLVGAGAA